MRNCQSLLMNWAGRRNQSRKGTEGGGPIAESRVRSLLCRYEEFQMRGGTEKRGREKNRGGNDRHEIVAEAGDHLERQRRVRILYHHLSDRKKGKKKIRKKGAFRRKTR